MNQRESSGIAGLDEVLSGGFIAGRSYLISGPPGTGKTTIGWHFLGAAPEPDPVTLFITFGESEVELRDNARRSGFDPDGTVFLDLSPSSELFAKSQTYDIFSASEVEREPTTRLIVDAVERLKPCRVFIDSMTSLRYLTTDDQEFRRTALSFVRFLVSHGAVVLMTSESSPERPDDDLRFLVDGVIEVALGARNRTIRVTKFRGSDFRSGPHTIKLDASGATVYPRLIPERFGASFDPSVLSSGLPAFDALLHGGIERGTVTLVTGPTGVGKSTLGMQFANAAAMQGQRTAVYTFDERRETLVRRCRSVQIPVDTMLATGTLRVLELEALRFGADEFANLVRADIEDNGTRIVMIDSVSGYRLAVAGDDLVERLHGLCRYLENVGVTVLLINELQDVLSFRISETGISYLADNVVYVRYLERSDGQRSELIRGVGVLKKRLSGFENTVREFRITPSGLQIGEPLVGILTPIVGRDSVFDTAS